MVKFTISLNSKSGGKHYPYAIGDFEVDGYDIYINTIKVTKEEVASLLFNAFTQHVYMHESNQFSKGENDASE